MPQPMVSNQWKGFRKAWFIAEEVVFIYGLTIDDLQKNTRTRTLHTAKAHIARRLKMETDLSWSEIGQVIGRKSRPRARDYFKKEELST